MIIEARKNPGKNPKLDGHSAAIEYLQSNDIYNNIEDYAVSMTNMPKIGINPGSEYSTPLGIFYYPALYYLKKKSSENVLPFQDEAKYIQIIKLTGKILYISKVNYDEYGSLIKKLYSISGELALQFSIDPRDLDKNIADFITNASRSSNVGTYGGYFWYILWRLSEYLSGGSLSIRYSSYGKIARRSAVVWNKLIRMLGYDIVQDDGDGIIHMNEPEQGVVVNPSGVMWISTFKNVINSDVNTIYGAKPWAIQLLKVKKSPKEYIEYVLNWLRYNTYISDGISSDSVVPARVLAKRLMSYLEADPELIELFNANDVRRVIWLSGNDPNIARTIKKKSALSDLQYYSHSIVELSRWLDYLEINIREIGERDKSDLKNIYYNLVQHLIKIISGLKPYSGESKLGDVIQKLDKLITRYQHITK
jgi:hypothetical protein